EPLAGVDLHHDPRVEVLPGVEVEVGVRVASEAVVAHHSVGDEVPGTGGDVEHREVHPQRLDRSDTQATLVLDRPPFDRPLPGDGGIHDMEEAEVLPEAAEQSNYPEPVGPG